MTKKDNIDVIRGVTDTAPTPEYNNPVDKPVDKSATTSEVTIQTDEGGGYVPAKTQQQFDGYDGIKQWLQKKVAEYEPETDEQRQKRRRRERTKGIIAGISDAVSSVANLVATANYAPNAPTAAMSERWRERLEKDKADRKALDNEYYNYAMALGKIKDTEETKGLAWWKAQMDAHYKELDNARKAAKEERDAKIADINMQVKAGELKINDAKAKTAEAEAEYAVRQQRLDMAQKQAKIRHENALASNVGKNTTAKEGKEKYTLTHYDKKTQKMVTKTYSNKVEWDKAVYKLADELGLPTTYHKSGDARQGTEVNELMRTEEIAGLVENWRPAVQKISIKKK